MISVKGRVLTPAEAVEVVAQNAKPPPVAPEAYDAVNELVVANLKNGYARVMREEACAFISLKCGVIQSVAQHWASVIIACDFREAGWTIYHVPMERYDIFALEPVPSNEAIWAKHHPGEPMPLLAHEHDYQLRKLTPGNNGGWGRDVASDFTWRTEKSRLEYMERLSGWQKMRQEVREQVWRKFHPDRPMPRVVFVKREEEDSCGTTERAILSFLESLEGETKQ